VTVDYISVSDFKSRVGITTTTEDLRIGEHVTAASRRVDGICRRTFAPHTGAATTRTFRPTNAKRVYVDDCYDITAVDVDAADDGTFATPWTASVDYETGPDNGVGQDGSTGHPVHVLIAVGTTYAFPCRTARRSVRVTAKWGWEAVPDAVTEATYLLAHRLYYEVKVPGGVTAPNVDFGLPGSPLSRPYTAEGLLRPYVNDLVRVVA
jgi:hypothetical protein